MISTYIFLFISCCSLGVFYRYHVTVGWSTLDLENNLDQWSFISSSMHILLTLMTPYIVYHYIINPSTSWPNTDRCTYGYFGSEMHVHVSFYVSVVAISKQESNFFPLSGWSFKDRSLFHWLQLNYSQDCFYGQ